MPHKNSVLSKTLPLLAAVSAVGSLPAVGAASLHTFHSTRVIGTTLDVQIATHDAAAAGEACMRVHNEISRLEAILSTRIPSSIISRINATNDPVMVSGEVIELLTAYQAAALMTDGICSPFMGELSARWSLAAREDRLPLADELASLVSRIQSTSLKVDTAAGTVQRIGPATLNIDALGKPFILAKAAQAAWSNQKNLAGILVNIGGDIVALGSMSSSTLTPWRVNVIDPSNPADNAAPLATLNMNRASVVTSGDYARGRMIEGQFVSHILDPRTGAPASHGIAATIMHEDPLVANALATAFCVGGVEQGRALATRAKADFLLAAADGVQISEKLPLATDADAPATQPAVWPKGFTALLNLNITAAGRPEKEYVAVWVEDAKGNYVKTLAVWGTDKYQRQALGTWLKLNVRATNSGATKNPGTYSLVWDGTDQSGKPVTQGSYVIRVEAGSEHGGHALSKATLTCHGDKDIEVITKSGAIDNSAVTYGPPAKPGQ